MWTKEASKAMKFEHVGDNIYVLFDRAGLAKVTLTVGNTSKEAHISTGADEHGITLSPDEAVELAEILNQWAGNTTVIAWVIGDNAQEGGE